jgi:hypothetical protein
MVWKAPVPKHKDNPPPKPSESLFEDNEPVYAKPKILLVDTPDECFSVLQSAGLNVQSGTFGNPYPITRNRDAHVVVSRASLPNCTEQEIVVIDLTCPKLQAMTPDEIKDLRTDNLWYVCPNSAQIDPRPFVMFMHSSNIERILDAGGIFIIFAQPRASQTITRGHDEQEIDNWSFLPILNSRRLEVRFDHGAGSASGWCKPIFGC